MSSYKKQLKCPKKPSTGSSIDADFRLKIEKDIENFVYNSGDAVFEFPPTLTSVERAFVHKLAPQFNLKTKSEGHDENRRLKLYKPTENDDFSKNYATIYLHEVSTQILKQFNREAPPRAKQENVRSQRKKEHGRSKIFSRAPHIPPPSFGNNNVLRKRAQLPIFSYRARILQEIKDNRILLVQGSTGSGKTTQIPQYILEHATENNKPCRILCTQPRRITAIASSDRVSFERNEPAMGSIGYQIRLESTVSQDTNCIFLTPGVFLRYLTCDSPQKLFNNITHIIIDEAHERAKENDFLLTSIKDHFNVNPELRLIIMSATMDTAVFSDYFGGCEEIAISVKQFNVEEIYLEDILKLVGFNNPEVQKLKARFESGQLTASSQSAYLRENSETPTSNDELDEETRKYVNEVLSSIMEGDDPNNDLEQFRYLVEAENVPVDFRHEKTNMTALMLAVGRGCYAAVETLLQLNANPNLTANYMGAEINCLDIAIKLHGPLSEFKKLLEKKGTKSSTGIDVYDKELLNIYYDSVFKTGKNNFVLDEGIDHNLIAQLIDHIHQKADLNEAILVFLPGYDDIMQMSNLVSARGKNDICLFLLHSSMKTDDQKNVFRPVMPGCRKIILSTNIAESSITIDDVVYVLDSGREKQKSYDAMSHSSSLRVQWISKASANQRKGRAGRLRDGVVYRIYSKDRYQAMLDTTIPELLRTSLTEICLQTKVMINENLKIEDFLVKCIAPPSIASIRQSIKLLQALGALDQNENLTELGSYLAVMPVDAKYGKMLIYAISLKCLEPVLSIVSILSMSDQIFVLPTKPADRYKCNAIREQMSEGTLSDHFYMLRIFQQWLKLKGYNRRFCEEHFISGASMEHVKGIRNQIMSYLQRSDLAKSTAKELNMNSHRWPVVKACLCAGLYPSVARIDHQKKTMFTDIDQNLSFHMSSVLRSRNERVIDLNTLCNADWVVFEEKNRIGRRTLVRCNTLVNSVTLSLGAGASLKSILEQSYHDSFGGESVFKIDDLVTFSATTETGLLLLNLRTHLDAMIVRFVSQHNFNHDQHDDRLVETVSKVLVIEERNSDFVVAQLASEFSVGQPDSSFLHNLEFTNSQFEIGHFQNNTEFWDSKPDVFNNKRSNKWKPNGVNKPKNGIEASNKKDSVSNQSNGAAVKNKPINPQSGADQWKQSGTFFANNSTKVAKPHSPSYYAINENSEKNVNRWAQQIVVDVEEFKLKSDYLRKFEQLISGGISVVLIFFSTDRQEFLGVGDIKPPTSDNKIQFHFRLLKTIPLNDLVLSPKLKKFRLFQDRCYQVQDLSEEIGCKIVQMFQS